MAHRGGAWTALRWGRRERTHQVDRAADVAVHEDHQAVHQVARREGRLFRHLVLSTQAWSIRTQPPPVRIPKPNGKVDVPLKSCKPGCGEHQSARGTTIGCPGCYPREGAGS